MMLKKTITNKNRITSDVEEIESKTIYALAYEKSSEVPKCSQCQKTVKEII